MLGLVGAGDEGIFEELTKGRGGLGRLLNGEEFGFDLFEGVGFGGGDVGGVGVARVEAVEIEGGFVGGGLFGEGAACEGR